MYCRFGDQTIGAKTKKNDIATIKNGTGRNTCKRKKKKMFQEIKLTTVISCIIPRNNMAFLATL